MSKSNSKKRVLVLENFESDFLNSRLPIIQKLLENYEFYACYPGSINSNLSLIKTLEFPLERKNKSIFQIIGLSQLIKKYVKTYNIDLIHAHRFQPNLIAALAKSKKTLVITHITGLGSVFGVSMNPLKWVSLLLYQIILKKSNVVITQNFDDFKDINLFGVSFIKKNKVVLGSGVDLNKFSPIKKSRTKNAIKILIVSRLLKSKGIIELIEAVQCVNSRNKLVGNQTRVKLDIVGWIDHDNPESINQNFIDNNSSQEIIFHGKSRDVVEFYRSSDVFCFPSKYREGIPRVLLEALSCAMPIITSDTPGCRICVKENGFLLKRVSKEAIVDALYKFCELNQSDRKKMMVNSRSLAEKFFSTEIITHSIDNIYKELLIKK
jgi:glycosyltransferase involved in cell wall biosynthesis